MPVNVQTPPEQDGVHNYSGRRCHLFLVDRQTLIIFRKRQEYLKEHLAPRLCMGHWVDVWQGSPWSIPRMVQWA